jgi:hypothetical protein
MLKQLNPNEHPKKPHQSVIDDLQYSHAEQRYNTKMKLAGKVYRPEDEGKADFQSKVSAPHKTFGEPAFFNTVFISGDDMVKEEALDK